MVLLDLTRALLRDPDFRFFIAVICPAGYALAAGFAAVGGY